MLGNIFNWKREKLIDIIDLWKTRNYQTRNWCLIQCLLNRKYWRTWMLLSNNHIKCLILSLRTLLIWFMRIKSTQLTSLHKLSNGRNKQIELLQDTLITEKMFVQLLISFYKNQNNNWFNEVTSLKTYLDKVLRQ